MQEKVWGAVNSAELVSDPGCPSSVVVLECDTKPVHFSTMATQRIFWEEKKRQVFDKSRNEITTIEFLRLNLNDECDFDMDDTDVTNQLRGSHHFDHWLSNYEWWHSTLWWVFKC